MQLTAGPLSFGAPEPSVDGKTIFAVGEQSRGGTGALRLADKAIRAFSRRYLCGRGTLLAHGKWLSYVSFPEGNLWRCRLDGSREARS